MVIPAIGMTFIVLLSNVLVQYTINSWLTWGAFSYPVAYLVTEVCNRWAGQQIARGVAIIGFIVGVLLSIWLATGRIALASGSAFLVSQLLDISIFNRLRRQTWWKAPLAAASMASIIDTLVFFYIAFAGSGENWWLLGLGDLSVKLLMALVLLIPFRIAFVWLKPIVKS